MSTDSTKENPATSLKYVKYTLLYEILIPFINWSFTWAPMWEVLPNWAFNPVTIVTGLVLVVRDFAQREIGHEVYRHGSRTRPDGIGGRARTGLG